MSTKSTAIRNLELTGDDPNFLRFFDHFSLFAPSPEGRRNVITSITDIAKLLRYAEQSPNFYKIAKSPELNSHWEKLLNKKHPSAFDELLRRECENMSGIAKEEKNIGLANAYEKLAENYDSQDSSLHQQQPMMR